MLTARQAAREGRFTGVDPLLAELLGREPRSVVDQFGDSIAA
jgi:NAD(P)H dehydrogenase (quinone)